MYAISIEPPHAAAILREVRPCHQRCWRTDHRGLLLIHAGRHRTPKRSSASGQSMKCNALVGVVELVDCIALEHAGADPDEIEYHWVLANPRVFIRPLPYTGRRGLFLVSEEVVSAALENARVPAQQDAKSARSAVKARRAPRRKKQTKAKHEPHASAAR